MKNYPHPSCSSKVWIVTKVELIFAQQITELDSQHLLKSFFMFYVSLFIHWYRYFDRIFLCGYSHQPNEFQREKEICIPDDSLIPAFLSDLIWINPWAQQQLLVFVYWKCVSLKYNFDWNVNNPSMLSIYYFDGNLCAFSMAPWHLSNVYSATYSHLYSLIIGNNRIKLFRIVVYSLLHTCSAARWESKSDNWHWNVEEWAPFALRHIKASAKITIGRIHSNWLP